MYHHLFNTSTKELIEQIQKYNDMQDQEYNKLRAQMISELKAELRERLQQDGVSR